MIIFYQKEDGKIVGTIEGRIHYENQLNMWVGDKNITDRIVVQWEKIKGTIDDFEPITSQKDIFIELDKNPMGVYKYKINLETKNLIKIS